MKKHAAERDAKGLPAGRSSFPCCFCQLVRADSRREICNGLACCLGRLVHVGIAKAPCRSTLSYANERRPAALFEELFWTVAARFRDQQMLGGRQHKFRFKNKLQFETSTSTRESRCCKLYVSEGVATGLSCFGQQ